MPEQTSDTSNIELATELTVAWLANPNTRAPADEIPAFLHTMHEALQNLSTPQPGVPSVPAEELVPAVSVRKSLASKDHILSMIDGKPYKTLRRHLARFGLTAEQYRERFGLKSDYPMVSESYSQARRAMAQKIGLGRKPRQQDAPPAPAPAKRTRKPKSAPAAARG